jgi:hypothetical protein
MNLFLYCSDVQSTSPPAPNNVWDQIVEEYQQIQFEPRGYRADPANEYDISPWLQRTGIYAHLRGLELNELGPSYRLPWVQEEPQLYLICESIGRVLEKAMTALKHGKNAEVQPLSRRNAQLLNTFTRKGTSQDPITELPNQESRQKYIHTWQELICFWDRVAKQGHLRGTLFRPSDRQLEVWCEVTDAASELASPTDPDCDEVTIQAFRDQLDRAVLEFSVAIIQHSVTGCRSDSVLLSYAAARFWNHRQCTWMLIGNYASILSQLIYDCQMVVLAQVLAMAEDNPGADIGAMIVDIRDQWLLDDTRGPVTELLYDWQYGSEICQTEDPRAQIRWYENEERVVWPEVSFHLSDLHRIVFEGIAEARQIFDEELCLNGRSSPACNIPHLDLGLLVDSWDATARGQSFLTDLRNASYLDPLKDWLFSRVGNNQVLFQTFWSQTATGNWVVCADAVQQYEDAVQRFLRALMVPFFIGSGQQGRRSEFLALRWRNTTWSTRDLFLHDGQMVYVLSYHKTRSQSNATRWPVRYLLPEVAQLVTQYLTLVQPFRKFLHCKAPGSGAVSDLLWSRGPEPWEDDALTQIVVDAGDRILGKHIHDQIWRQITMAITQRKFTSDEANLLIEEGGDGDNTDAVLATMEYARQCEAADTPYTGNRAYGGPVNFQGGLTDAELQEFRHVGQLWHQLVRDPLHFQRIPRSDTANHV